MAGLRRQRGPGGTGSVGRAQCREGAGADNTWLGRVRAQQPGSELAAEAAASAEMPLAAWQLQSERGPLPTAASRGRLSCEEQLGEPIDPARLSLSVGKRARSGRPAEKWEGMVVRKGA